MANFFVSLYFSPDVVFVNVCKVLSGLTLSLFDGDIKLTLE